MKLSHLILTSFLVLTLGGVNAQAEDSVRLNATVLIASNNGNDFNLDNDDYRDELIKLFSYSAYNQIEVKALSLPDKMSLPEGYGLSLIAKGQEGGSHLVEAVIEKAGQNYVDTTLSISQPGVVFVGGPPLEDGGVLILVLEIA